MTEINASYEFGIMNDRIPKLPTVHKVVPLEYAVLRIFEGMGINSQCSKPNNKTARNGGFICFRREAKH
jgi:hypothetical protein